MSFWAWLALALGGAVGAWARFHADQWLAPRWKKLLSTGPAWAQQTSVGMAILTINLIGSFLAGLLAGSGWLSPSLWLVIGTGVLGGWTIFSTAMMDAFNALTVPTHQPRTARLIGTLLLAFAGLLLCVLAAAAGGALAHVLVTAS